MEIKILDADSKDMEEILALQKAAYRSEAIIYDDYSISPLHQTIEEIQNEFKNQLFIKGIKENTVLGSVRGYEKNGTCFIGKLIVDPTYQNKGIGTKLLIEIENRFTHAQRFELFTGHKSSKNLHLYDKLGYKEFKRKNISNKLTLIFLEKYNNS